MNRIFQTANAGREAVPFKEVVPFWFAVSSPVIGVIMGLLGAWFVTWLNM